MQCSASDIKQTLIFSSPKEGLMEKEEETFWHVPQFTGICRGNETGIQFNLDPCLSLLQCRSLFSHHV